MTDLPERLRIKASMIELGERIAWGSDSALMREAADALEMAAPAVQGEPVGEVRLELGAPSYVFAELHGENLPSLVPGTKLYTAPQPAPDAAGLVEALEEIVKQYPNPNISHENFRVHACRHAESALSAHRKGDDA